MLDCDCENRTMYDARDDLWIIEDKVRDLMIIETNVDEEQL